MSQLSQGVEISLDENVFVNLPSGTKVMSISPSGASAWVHTIRIECRVKDGSVREIPFSYTVSMVFEQTIKVVSTFSILILGFFTRRMRRMKSLESLHMTYSYNADFELYLDQVLLPKGVLRREAIRISSTDELPCSRSQARRGDG